MLFSTGNKIVVMGDSITDCGRAVPIGEGHGAALGAGWVSMASALLGAVMPELRLRIVNMGTSGNTVRDLSVRWERDVFQLAPDWVTVMIGTNDVWRQHDLPMQPETHVYPDEYTETLERLVTSTLPQVKGMVLMTPFYLEPIPTDAMRAMMDRYGRNVKEIAERHGTLFIDTQRAMEPILCVHHSSQIAWDRVHPSATGHMAIAKAFLDAVGFEWNR